MGEGSNPSSPPSDTPSEQQERQALWRGGESSQLRVVQHVPLRPSDRRSLVGGELAESRLVY